MLGNTYVLYPCTDVYSCSDVFLMEIYGVSRQSKIPYISNNFAKCDHKGELSAVFSAIYYLKLNVGNILVIRWLAGHNKPLSP